jgi:hypothetical protein
MQKKGMKNKEYMRIEGSKTENPFDNFIPVVPIVSKIIASNKYNQLIKSSFFNKIAIYK